MWSLLILAIPLVTAEKLGGIMLAPLALITLAAFEAVSSLPLAAQWWHPVRTAAGRMFELVETQPAVDERPLIDAPDSRRLSSAQTPAAPNSMAVRVTDLTFTYPGEITPALRHITFDIPAGHSLCIVGASGAGKSTLVNLFVRFWEYDSGELFLGGASLRSCSADEVRRQISLVSQDAHFFDTSIFENLRMAGRGVCREAVERAAREAQIHDFIAGLPAGYDTLVGEHGLRLSAGERQRLAIARALIKDAPLLILDEPTANLDTVTERLILETLFQVMKRKTSLLITHRLVGLENLDQILVLSRGSVVERGSQARLLERRGTYRRLWDLQNRIWIRP
jgi:ATP-binding cassette subfamily C protein CydC